MMMMMQLSESPIEKKNSLFNTMHRFLGAVNTMDETVMVPSLLRDVPLDQDRDQQHQHQHLDQDQEEVDMYDYYQLLKSIRQDIELGVRRAALDDEEEEDRRMGMGMKMKKITRVNSSTSLASMTSSAFSASSSSSDDDEEEEEEEGNLQKQLQFHLTGLHGVLSKLTVQANSLTQRYKQEVGIGGWGQ